jgi:hypothetical protein
MNQICLEKKLLFSQSSLQRGSMCLNILELIIPFRKIIDRN